MLDIRFIVENEERVREVLAQRRSDVDLTRVIELHARQKALLKDVEQLKAERNSSSKEIGRLKAQEQDTSEAQEAVRRLGERIREADQEVLEVEGLLQETLLEIPNMLQGDVPVGADESANLEVRTFGTPPSFDFEPRPHWEIGEALGILDFPRAAKLSGARFAVLRGAGAALERALISFMLDLHTTRHGYVEVLPPYLVTRETMTGTGQLPKFEADAFKIAGERELFLIPTAEVPVTNLHAKEMLDEAQLPISYVAFTPCFRSEAGSYGKDVRGLIRLHQFHKVELVKFTHPDRSTEALEELTGHAEAVLEALELPYRRVILSSGDIGFSSSKTYDLEVWLPGQQTYREISSCSNFLDFQARRANIRFRPSGPKAKPRFVHTLNGSGLAVGRTLVAILENYQEADGSVRVPACLQPYLRMERIVPDGTSQGR